MSKQNYTYEVWIHQVTEDPETGELRKTWHQILEGDDPVWANEKRALAAAGKAAQRVNAMEAVVFERRVRIRLNGPCKAPVNPSTRLALVKGGKQSRNPIEKDEDSKS